MSTTDNFAYDAWKLDNGEGNETIHEDDALHNVARAINTSDYADAEFVEKLYEQACERFDYVTDEDITVDSLDEAVDSLTSIAAQLTREFANEQLDYAARELSFLDREDVLSHIIGCINDQDLDDAIQRTQDAYRGVR